MIYDKIVNYYLSKAIVLTIDSDKKKSRKSILEQDHVI